MIEINILEFIPQELRQQAQNALVDFVSEQAKKFVSNGTADKLKQLRSDGAFRRQFDKGLDRAIKRFSEEYYDQDEVLVETITQEKDLFKNPEVKQALMTMLKSPGSYLADEGDVVAQTFDSVLPGRKNRERVNKAMMYLLRCLVEELWHLPELQPVYSLQFQKITAEAMKQQVELQKGQLQALVGVNEGVRQALLQLTDAIGKKEMLLSGETPQEEFKQSIIHNLPQPDYGKFVGREKEIEQILGILQPYPRSQSHLLTIDGIGGIGKSTLALEIANHYLRNDSQLPIDERFEAIIWVSAKRTILTADGIKPRAYTLNTLDDIYSAISITLHREDITRASLDEQSEIVRQALKKQRTLLIVDNLETIDDDSVLTFLRELPAPTKCIVTTRHRIDVAYPTRLVGMPWNDGEQLILNECERKGVYLGKDHIRRFYQRTGGIPLALVWSIAQVSMGHSPEGVLNKLGIPSSDIAKYCFYEVIENIRKSNSYIILFALSLFEASASRISLQYVTELPELECEDGLATLERLSLVNKVNDRFSILPLTRYFMRGEINQYSELEKKITGKLFEYYTGFMNEQKLGGLDALLIWESEKDNISTIIDKLINEENHSLMVELFGHYYHFLWRRGYWAEGIKIATQILDWAEVSGHRDTRARFSHWLGRFNLYQGKYKDAEITLIKSADSYLVTDWQWISVQTYLGRALLKQGRTDEAIDILQNTLAIAMERDDFRGATRLHNVLAEAMLVKNDLDAALAHVQNGYELAIGRNKQVTVFGKNLHLRGILERLKGNLEDAEQWILQFREIANREGFVLEIAEAELELAYIFAGKGDFSAAKTYALSAKGTFERIGIKTEMEKCDNLIQ
ncbi:MAG: AAA family ATPase [Chloroflexi bacterium]|nr:AAA family ATPase [Chloroflexota bacterium]